MKTVRTQVHPTHVDAFWDLITSIHTARFYHMTTLIKSRVGTPVMRVIDFPSSTSSAKNFIMADLREAQHRSPLIGNTISLK